jgi:hypothetical protein
MTPPNTSSDNREWVKAKLAEMLTDEQIAEIEDEAHQAYHARMELAYL